MSSSRVYLENLLYIRHLFQLLLEDRFRYIDKIKTSGTTYMAVVGLRPDRIIQDTEESITNHLSTLLEFYFALRSKVQSFNENHGFSFSLRAGKPPIYISIYIFKHSHSADSFSETDNWFKLYLEFIFSRSAHGPSGGRSYWCQTTTI